MDVAMISIIRYALALFISVCSMVSYATVSNCNYIDGTSASSSTVTIPPLTVQRDTSAGEILWESGSLTAPNTSSVECTAASPIWRGYDDSTLTRVNVLDNNNIYQTNNPGIAIRVWWASSTGGSWSSGRAFQSPRAKESSGTCSGAVCSYTNIRGAFKVQLIATGAPITNEPLQLSRFSASRSYDETPVIHISFSDVDVEVNSVSCILNSKSIAVDLGKHILGTHLVHPGDTSTPVGFNIDLTCDEGTNVNVLFSGATVSGDNTTLALSNPTDSTSAQGVGVQVLYNDQPVTFGTLLPAMQNVAEGGVILPFQAQILRLNEELKAGEVNATATFEMIYR
ncbi:hypothetical protein DLR11_16470 [Salmonella enterica subsp. salamae]|uniref:Fimbrial-type adhesion domain-containing protein n=1 Tax=Salmonella enterica subsp. salamae TaxID=59202 RepID=A0A5Y3V265_SALER|nr:hypothetical protein [Salmonella enterica subsp. salamae]EDH0695128.1 fimbrial protein [Salmonella enterica]EHM1752404.1 fimbrial protein [Salmonella enterica subsp. salamae serovar 40:c:e,n,x,z15]HCM2000945.1 fimbrial protein [Salmonella enterica subsp. salamae serovar [1],40:z35:e,n,x,z15]ECG8516649.1 hypothetical protein [Salmonella enterica subsp. salamae]